MTLSEFKLNDVVIKTPQGLDVQKAIERQRVVLLSGKPKERVKRVYRIATLKYSQILNSDLQKIIAETLTKSIESGSPTVSITFMGMSGTMETMTANFSDFSASTVSESIRNDRWSNISDITFEEV